MENALNFLPNLSVNAAVECIRRDVFIHLEIQFDRKIGRFFRGESLESRAEKGRLACLPRRENDNIAALFHAPDEISQLFLSANNVILFGIHGAPGFKRSHHFLLLSGLTGTASLIYCITSREIMSIITFDFLMKSRYNTRREDTVSRGTVPRKHLPMIP